MPGKLLDEGGQPEDHHDHAGHDEPAAHPSLFRRRAACRDAEVHRRATSLTGDETLQPSDAQHHNEQARDQSRVAHVSLHHERPDADCPWETCKVTARDRPSQEDKEQERQQRQPGVPRIEQEAGTQGVQQCGDEEPSPQNEGRAAPAASDNCHPDQCRHVQHGASSQDARLAEQPDERGQQPVQERARVVPAEARRYPDQGRVHAAHVTDMEDLERLVARGVPLTTEQRSGAGCGREHQQSGNHHRAQRTPATSDRRGSPNGLSRRGHRAGVTRRRRWVLRAGANLISLHAPLLQER